MCSDSSDKPLKVLIIPEYSRSGGTLTFLLKLLRIHRKNGIKSAVLIPGSQQFPEAMKIFGDMNVAVFTTPNRKAFFRKSYASLLFDFGVSIPACLLFRPDLIVVSNGTTNLMFGILAWPVPVIFTLHSYPTGWPWGKKRSGMRLFLRVMCRFKKNVFLTVSKFSALKICKYLEVPPDSVRVIYNSAKEVVKRSRSENKTVLTVGHLVWYKNPECWLEVAGRVLSEDPDVRFLWVGHGELAEDVRRRIREMALGGNLILEGDTPNVDDHYGKSAVYFQPSLLETHGISLIEAMAHGLPCIGSDVGGIPESIVHGETGFICAPTDVDSFSTHLLLLLESRNLRAQMGEAGRRRARTLFSELLQEDKIMALYGSLVPYK